MKGLVLAILSCPTWVTPALAWMTPIPVNAVSPVCTVAYNPNEGVQVHADAGMTLTIQLSDSRTIKQVAVSDHVHLKTSTTGNILWLKPTVEMDPQPISIRAVRDDGKAEIYLLRWTTKPEAEMRTCDLVRFTYPQDVIEARRADQEKKRLAWEAVAASRALHAVTNKPAEPSTGPSVWNKAYTITGDATLLPQQVAPSVIKTTSNNATRQPTELDPTAIAAPLHGAAH